MALADPDELDERLGNRKDRKPKSMNFFSKFIQIQTLAFSYNAGLTESHPYQSSPSSWPFVKNGISFWMQDKGQKQIYLVGNVVGWWTTAGAVFLAFGVFTAVIIAKRRKTPILSECRYQNEKNHCRGAHSSYSCHQSSVEFMRLLRHDLGCTLCPLLLFQQTALFASLPSCPPRFCLGRWCCSQSHLH